MIDTDQLPSQHILHVHSVVHDCFCHSRIFSPDAAVKQIGKHVFNLPLSSFSTSQNLPLVCSRTSATPMNEIVYIWAHLSIVLVAKDAFLHEIYTKELSMFHQSLWLRTVGATAPWLGRTSAHRWQDSVKFPFPKHFYLQRHPAVLAFHDSKFSSPFQNLRPVPTDVHIVKARVTPLRHPGASSIVFIEFF